MKSLNEALRQFEATEANLAKLETLWQEIKSTIPDGICFGDDTDGRYDDLCRAFGDVLAGTPLIDGWKPPLCLYELNEIGQMRYDADIVGEFDCYARTEELIFEQERHLKAYSYRLSKRRRDLVRGKLLEVIDCIDADLQELFDLYPDKYDYSRDPITAESWDRFKQHFAIVDTLLGSEARPQRWSEVKRRIVFGELRDVYPLRTMDWPSVRSGISRALYAESDPIPVEVTDLGTLVEEKPSGEVVTKLKWESLSPADFERLVFCLISESAGYENPKWLTSTNAADRGRDLSVTRVMEDALVGTMRYRVIIQCKHWLSKSVSLDDIASIAAQMKLWEPPRVDVLVVATSGRFTTDAVDYVEKSNQSDCNLRIEMWAESHLERLLASRPALIAEFALR